MITFFIIAGLLLIAVVGLILAPIIRTPSDRPRYLTVLATGIGLPVFAIGLYLAIGNWQLTDPALSNAQSAADASTQAGPESVEAMVGKLAARLQAQGGSAQEWQMLGRSYKVMGRFGDALQAFSRARDEDSANEPELLGEYAEALVLANAATLSGEAGQLFEEVLNSKPQDPRALFYGGIAALERGENDMAVQRWQTLLSQNPPEELRAVLQARIAQAGGTLNGDREGSDPVADTRADNRANVGSKVGSKVGTTITVSVSAADEILKNLDPQTPVFVLARSGQPGPPLAARKMRVADLPFEISLSAADAMIASRTIDVLDADELVARIALSGTPQAQSGDLFGKAVYESSKAGATIRIVINQRVE